MSIILGRLFHLIIFDNLVSNIIVVIIAVWIISSLSSFIWSHLLVEVPSVKFVYVTSWIVTVWRSTCILWLEFRVCSRCSEILLSRVVSLFLCFIIILSHLCGELLISSSWWRWKFVLFLLLLVKRLNSLVCEWPLMVFLLSLTWHLIKRFEHTCWILCPFIDKLWVKFLLYRYLKLKSIFDFRLLIIKIS